MWNKPHVLNALADLLFLVGLAALLAVGAVWLVRVPTLPIREVVFAQELQYVRRLEVEQVLPGALKGNFFSVNLDAVRGALEKLPWIRRAEVRRIWPARLEVRVEEHRPAARWEVEGAPAHNEMVNTFGEVFAANLSPAEAGRLPVLHGPVGTAPDLLKRYEEWREAFRPLGQRPVAVQLSPRLSWQLRLENGMAVELGREQPKSPVGGRLARFIEVYGETVGKRDPLPAVVDLRYPNGFALRGAVGAGKGK